MSNGARNLFWISMILIPMLFVIWIGLVIDSGKVYIEITDINKQEVYELLENLNISTDDNIKRVGYRQGLGDWYLYIDYEHINDSQELLGDDYGQELYEYIKDNKEKSIDDYFLVFVFIIMNLFIIYVVLYLIVRLIQKSASFIDKITEEFMKKEFEKDKEEEIINNE